MTADIEPGDMVQLRSGGPPMVIEVVEGELVSCCYFDCDSRLHKETFAVDALKKFEEESSES